MPPRIKRAILTPKNYIYFILIFTLLVFMLCDIPGVPGAIQYLNDMAVCILGVFLVARQDVRDQIKQSGIRWILLAMLAYSAVNLLTVGMNQVSLLLVLWAARKIYRFFVFWLACVVFLKKADMDKLFDIFYIMQYANLILIAYQFFFMGIKQDGLGGLFGYGGNSGLLAFSLLTMTHAIAKYLAGEFSHLRFWFLHTFLYIVSVMAELRAYFLFMFAIILVNLVLNRNSRRNIYIIAGTVLLYLSSNALYSILFPYVDLSIGAMVSEAQSTGGGYNISRLRAFHEINTIFFNGDVSRNIFGYGFGNCEQSGLAVFTSDFYRSYGDYHYHWFMHQNTFLETGYAGVAGYLSILATMLLFGYLTFRKSASADRPMLITGISMNAVCFVLFIYNSCLKADYAYFVFLSLAIPAIIQKSNSANTNMGK